MFIKQRIPISLPRNQVGQTETSQHFSSYLLPDNQVITVADTGNVKQRQALNMTMTDGQELLVGGSFRMNGTINSADV